MGYYSIISPFSRMNRHISFNRVTPLREPVRQEHLNALFVLGINSNVKCILALVIRFTRIGSNRKQKARPIIDAVLERFIQRILASFDEIRKTVKTSRDQVVVKTPILYVLVKERIEQRVRERNVIDDPLELLKLTRAFFARFHSRHESAIIHQLCKLKIIMFQCKRDRITLIGVPTGLRLVL